MQILQIQQIFSINIFAESACYLIQKYNQRINEPVYKTKTIIWKIIKQKLSRK